MTRLLVIGAGSLAACMLPYELRRLRSVAPGLDVRVGLTGSALRFVSPTALAMLSGREVELDRWPSDEGPRALHVELAEWPDAVVVYPATAHLVARLASGLCDTPFLTALAGTAAPVGIAPSLPPGVVRNPAHQRHVAELASWPNVVVAGTRTGTSATTGREGDGAAGPLSEVLGLMRSRFFPDDPAWLGVGEPTAVDGGRVLGAAPLAWAERTS